MTASTSLDQTKPIATLHPLTIAVGTLTAGCARIGLPSESGKTTAAGMRNEGRAHRGSFEANVEASGWRFEVSGQTLKGLVRTVQRSGLKRSTSVDPKPVQAARELRDRWMEAVGSGQLVIESNGKYDVARLIASDACEMKASPSAA